MSNCLFRNKPDTADGMVIVPALLFKWGVDIYGRNVSKYSRTPVARFDHLVSSKVKRRQCGS